MSPRSLLQSQSCGTHTHRTGYLNTARSQPKSMQRQSLARKDFKCFEQIVYDSRAGIVREAATCQGWRALSLTSRLQGEAQKNGDHLPKALQEAGLSSRFPGSNLLQHYLLTKSSRVLCDAWQTWHTKAQEFRCESCSPLQERLLLLCLVQ